MANKSNKPVKMTPPTQEQQLIRTLAMKREQYFTLILGNLLRNESVMAEHYSETDDGKLITEVVDIKDVIDIAFEGSAYILNKMYANEEGK